MSKKYDIPGEDIAVVIVALVLAFWLWAALKGAFFFLDGAP